MGALVRGRQANRFRAIIKHAFDGDIGIDPARLEAVISGYDEGGGITNEKGEEVSELDDALSRLSPEEMEKLKKFTSSIRDGTHVGIPQMLAVAEDADELPSGYEPGAKGFHESLLHLLCDILGDLP